MLYVSGQHVVHPWPARGGHSQEKRQGSGDCRYQLFLQLRPCLQDLARLDSEMSGLEERGEGREDRVEMRESRPPAQGGQARPVQSCNLEQLYHEALPLDKALSHR